MLLSVIVLLPASAHCQYSEWLPCSGPANIASIAVAPNGDYFVSGTDLLYRSTDHGMTWTANRAGPFQSTRYDGIYNLEGPIQFTSAGMLVDGYLTTDYGAHWIHNANAPFGDNIVADPAEDFMCGILGDPNFRVVASSDGGLTWNEFIGSTNMDSILYLVGVTSDRVLFGYRPGAGLVRFESGQWKTVDSIPPNGPLFEISPGILMLLENSHHQLGRSYDNGKTWVIDSTNLTPNCDRGSAPTLEQRGPSSFLSDNYGERVFESLDTGRTTQFFVNSPFGYGTTDHLLFMAGDSTQGHQLFSDGIIVQAPQLESDGFKTIIGSALNITDFAVSKYGTLFATGGSEDPYYTTLFESIDSGISWLPSTFTFNGNPVTGITVTIDSDDFKYLTNPRDLATP
ncbi:MAG TPA: sialidase family protein, partial [Candidatus Kapabacteria bacterium]